MSNRFLDVFMDKSLGYLDLNRFRGIRIGDSLFTPKELEQKLKEATKE